MSQVTYRYFRFQPLCNYWMASGYDDLYLTGLKFYSKNVQLVPAGVISDPTAVVTAPASNVIDNLASTHWQVTGNTGPEAYKLTWGIYSWLTVDLGSSLKSDAYTVQFGNVTYGTGNPARPRYDPKCWQLFGSNDNATWSLISEIHGQYSIANVGTTRNITTAQIPYSPLHPVVPGYVTAAPTNLPRWWSNVTAVEVPVTQWMRRKLLGQTSESAYRMVQDAHPHNPAATGGNYRFDRCPDVTLSGSRTIHFDTNYFLGSNYGGGFPDHDRIWEYGTDANEPFPTQNGYGGAFQWQSIGLNTTGWSAIGLNDATGRPFWSWLTNGGVAGNSGVKSTEDSPYWVYNDFPSTVPQWPGASFWWNDEPCASIFCFGDTRYNDFNVYVGGQALRIDEHADPENYEHYKPSELSPSTNAQDISYYGDTALLNRDEWRIGAALWNDDNSTEKAVQRRKYIRWTDPQISVTDMRIVCYIRKTGVVRATDIAKLGGGAKYRVYTKTSAPSYTYPWANSPWSGTHLFDVNLQYTYNAHLVPNGSSWTEPECDQYLVDGATITNLPGGASVTYEDVNVNVGTYLYYTTSFTTYPCVKATISGLSQAQISSDGVYAEFIWAPEIMFTQPQFAAECLTQGASQYTHYDSSLTMNVDIEYLTTIDGSYRYVLPHDQPPPPEGGVPPPLRHEQRDDGLGGFEGHARINTINSERQSGPNGPRLPGPNSYR